MRRRLKIAGIGFVAGIVLLIVAFFGLSAVTGDHTLRSVTYAQTPPHSGDHAPVWQRCGFYAEPVRDENAVHALEHGVVWITYRPGLPAEQIDVLRALTRLDDEVLVSPYPGLPVPVVISAWGRQASLDAIDDVRLTQALEEIRDGPEAPEPGGGCEGPYLWLSGATGDPEA